MSKLKSALRGVLLFCLLAGAIKADTIGWQYIAEAREASAPIRITLNPGGQLGLFYEDYAKQRTQGRHYIIDGYCISACTLITGQIPSDHVCVTPYAKLAFHSATEGDGGEFSAEGTRLMWHVFPEKVRALLRQHGWDGEDPEKAEHPDLIYIEGDELLTLIAPCKENS